jgi:two-component system, cell cycle response regulator
VVLQGPSFGDVYGLDGPSLGGDALVLGSDPFRSDVVVRDIQVEPRHAKVFWDEEAGGFTLKDLGTGDAVAVNRESVEGERKLACGDRIYLGNSVLEFVADDPVREHFHREINRLINRDYLTGLLAKNRFDERFEQALEACREMNAPLSVLMADIDNLKEINDAHGHLLGEFTVGEVGRLIREECSADPDHATRFGGDEYQVLLMKFGKEEALKVADKIRRCIEEYSFEKDGIHANPTLSIGVATYPEDGATTDDLTRAADAALYRAKNAGGNTVSP